MFGPRTWDTSLYDFLRLRVRSSGDGMRYFVNIQTDGPGAFSPSLDSGSLTLSQSAPTSSNIASGSPPLPPTKRRTNGPTSLSPSPTLPLRTAETSASFRLRC